MVHFAGVDQIVVLAPADGGPVPLRAIECETGNGQLPLWVGVGIIGTSRLCVRRHYTLAKIAIELLS